MRMQQSLSGVHLITLEGALDRTVEDGSEHRSRELKPRCLLCADLRSITHELRSSAVTETGTYELIEELEQKY
jgi:hypothetical protein